MSTLQLSAAGKKVFKDLSLKLMSVLLCMGLAISLCAKPARTGLHKVYQPDGFSFSVLVSGDEFIRIKTTENGSPVIQDEDGYWSFARYDEQGIIYSTGKHVGPGIGKSPFTVPYEKLLERAGIERSALRQTHKSSHSPVTKSGSDNGVKGVVILAAFNDVAFNYKKEDFDHLLNEKAYGKYGANGSAKDYFESQCEDGRQFDFTVSNIVTLPKNRKYYGQNSSTRKDKNIAEMVADACRLADKEIDFSQFDQDGDGTVDHLFVFYPGEDEAEGFDEDCIWSQSWYLYEGGGIDLVIDGTRLNHFACSSELSVKEGEEEPSFTSIGPFCHEFCHTLGLPDMYDTDYEKSGGYAPGLWGSLSIMDKGCYNNSGNTPPCLNGLERELSGIGDTMEELPSGKLTLKALDDGGKAYKLNSEKDGEYYVFECRRSTSWDSYIGGEGLLVYHIDRSDNDAGYSETFKKRLTASDRWNEAYNEINCRPDHECAGIFPASPAANATEQLFFPYLEYNSMEAEGLRPIIFWSGVKSSASIRDISRGPEGCVEIVVSFNKEDELPEPVIEDTDLFQDAAILSWSSKTGFEGITKLNVCGEDKSKSYEVKAFEDRRFACVLDSLAPGTNYKVELYFTIGKKEGPKTNYYFTTKSLPTSECYPFIMMKNVQRNEDGSFPEGTKLPLRVSNAVNVEKIIWTYGGNSVNVGTNGYFCPSVSGELKATIYNKDGSKDVIVRKIRIK